MFCIIISFSGLGYNQIKDQLPATIEVACHNGPESCTISGPTEDMEVFVKELQDRRVFARLVNVANIAYHSRYIKPAAPLLHKYLQEVLPEPVARTRKWISTSNKVRFLFIEGYFYFCYTSTKAIQTE